MLGIFCINLASAQDTSENLGKKFYEFLKTNNESVLTDIMPNADIVLEFSKNIGLEKSDDEKNQFKEMYPKIIGKYKKSIEILKVSGTELGLNWSTAELKNVTVVDRSQPNSTMKVADLNVNINSGGKTYDVFLRSVFQINGKWYLSPDNPSIEEL